MADDTTRPATPPPTAKVEGASVGEVVDYVKRYAKQETLGPLKGAGTWIAMGAAAAVSLGIGIIILLLGLLRVLQVETDMGTSEWWSWVPYLIVILVGAAITAIVVSRINKTYLDPKDKR
ncbi:MAG: phage holin family protein [Ilumatobacter fluminis]|uniref:Putative superfamily III holin-X n=1 Tax=Ilumatobacter fluminis TaxID=467091 RepID=A0A4R7HZ76_9ACTN|nr:phage holin family protein [Ilumatobacter fluminis]TDT16415.1 putative superfamily III holin-X [Ilumatobacter fluminis]